MRILLVEDDIMLGKALEQGLKQSGFNVEWMEDGESAMLALEASEYSLVLLDVNLPKMSGLQVLKKYRSSGENTPVLIMTARDAIDDRVEGLNLGADDYLVKPFDLKELIARVRALIRRTHGRSDSKIICKDVELDVNARIVRKNGEIMKFPAKEFKVLSLLMENSGKLLSKNEIEENIYDLSEEIESNTVETAIYSLRKKLGKDFITTIRGVGYMVSS